MNNQGWFMKVKNFFRRTLLKIIARCSKFIAIWNVPYLNKIITSKDYRAIQELLVPGQTILSAKFGELSNLFIPGDFGHAAIVKDNCTIIEATTIGVIETDLIDFVMTKDRIVLLKPKFANEIEMAQAVIMAQTQLGKPYDYSLEFSESNTEQFYCSELVYYSYLNACKFSPFTLRCVIGLMSVTPSDFLLATDKFEVVWESKYP